MLGKWVVAMVKGCCSGLCEECVQSLGLTASELDFLFRTSPRAFLQQTTPKPISILNTAFLTRHGQNGHRHATNHRQYWNVLAIEQRICHSYHASTRLPDMFLSRKHFPCMVYRYSLWTMFLLLNVSWQYNNRHGNKKNINLLNKISLMKRITQAVSTSNISFWYIDTYRNAICLKLA